MTVARNILPAADAPDPQALRLAAQSMLGNTGQEHLRDLLTPLAVLVRGMALRDDAVDVIEQEARQLGLAALVRLAWLVPIVEPRMRPSARSAWHKWQSANRNLRWLGPEPLALFQIEAHRRWDTADEWARSLGLVRTVEAAKIRQLLEHGQA
jgi:hypothetical protein